MSSSTESEHDNRLWEHGDSCSDDSTSFLMSTPTTLSEQAITPHSSQISTPGLNSPMSAIALSSQESTNFFPTSSTSIPRKQAGRRSNKSKFHGNQHMSRERIPVSLDESIDTLPSPTSKSKRFQITRPHRGYTSRHSTPFPYRKQQILFKRATTTTSKQCSIPFGMRILDVGILAQAMTKLTCSVCDSRLVLYESEFLHGWNTTFYIKCSSCHQLFAEFPSSKPLGTDTTDLVNAKLPVRGMNEVTMRSVLAVHCSGFSWRDLHKFASIFDMPAPLEEMPSPYLNKIEGVIKSAAEESMQAAADELHLEGDQTPSSVPDCINIAVSFDSSWKTRGFYSNLGFGSAISAVSKKVLDYELLNRICEKCNRWSAKLREESPDEYQKWYDSHKANCRVNHTGSSQSMEPAAATLIWSRSVQKRKLCYTTFIGDGDSKSFQKVSDMNPYNDTPIRKEECLAHVSKRLKKALCKVKKNTKNHTYIQHKLTEPKAVYISSNYSTVILQHRNQSPAAITQGLNFLLSHASGIHDNCPMNAWCRWKQTSISSKPPPTALTNYTQQDIAKIREVFQIYCTEEFCSHLTLGMTQNANESLHNIIWNFCPKAKYVSPQSVTISTAVAVTVFNEGELSIYGFMRDLHLHPTYLSYRSLCKREHTRRKRRAYFQKSNVDRRVRRQKLTKERRERDLLRLEGGRSYQSSSFGSETFLNPPKGRSIKARKSRASRIATTTRTEVTSRHDDSGSETFLNPLERRSIKTRRPRASQIVTTTRTEVTSRHDDSAEDSLTLSSNSNTDNSSDASSDVVCDICHERQPPPERHRSISQWLKIMWVECDSCDRWSHQCCTELSNSTDVRSIDYTCYHCN